MLLEDSVMRCSQKLAQIMKDCCLVECVKIEAIVYSFHTVKCIQDIFQFKLALICLFYPVSRL